jgi:hypothetical protein
MKHEGDDVRVFSLHVFLQLNVRQAETITGFFAGRLVFGQRTTGQSLIKNNVLFNLLILFKALFDGFHSCKTYFEICSAV